MIETEKPKLKYRVIDLNDDSMRIFFSLEKAKDFLIGYCRKKYKKYYFDLYQDNRKLKQKIFHYNESYYVGDRRKVKFRTETLSGIFIENNFGDIISQNYIEKIVNRKFSNSRFDHYDYRDSLLVRKRKNPNKIKKQYITKKKQTLGFYGEWEEYHSLPSPKRYRQKISSIRKLHGICKDEGEFLVRGKERQNCYFSWEPYERYLHYKSRESWKHNSKRKHQWKCDK